MKIYRELHLSKNFDDFVTEREIKKFIKDIDLFIKPTEKSFLNETGYIFSKPVSIAGITKTWLDLFEDMGWKYVNTYWMNDHKVLTFIKNE